MYSTKMGGEGSVRPLKFQLPNNLLQEQKSLEYHRRADIYARTEREPKTCFGEV